MDILKTSLLVNATTIAIILIAALIAFRSNMANKTMFIVGLVVICSSGIIAIPFTEFAMSIFGTGIYSVVGISNIVGLIHGAGILICAVSYARSKQRA